MRSAAIGWVLIVLAFTSRAAAQDYKAVDVDLDIDPAKLEEILNRSLAFEFSETTLEDVARELSQRLQISVLLDRRAISDQGVTPETLVTYFAPAVRVESALNWILREHDLTWMPGNEGLVITTEDMAESHQITRVYPVYDLAVARLGDKLLNNSEELIDTLTTSIEPDKWEENGGNGSIEELNGALVVSQTWQVHRKVERTLAALRVANTQAPAEWKQVILSPVTAPNGGLTAQQRSIYALPIPSSAIRTYR